METINKKYLTGLRYRGSVKKDGRWGPFDRALKATDVLSWSESEDDVTIVAADGQKHVVGKSGAPAAANPDQQTASSPAAPSILPRDIPGGKGQ